MAKIKGKIGEWKKLSKALCEMVPQMALEDGIEFQQSEIGHGAVLM